ncbi:MAG: hypothetical protein HYS57_00185, partial [Parcubacteria group bacterium]|nr:hypothetical protein [Parcubacteria group bacterium]
VDTILAKYRLLLEKISEQYPKEADQLEAWLLETAASEIEEALRKSEEDRLYVTFMYEAMRSRTKIAHELDAGDVSVQIYLASHRSLLQVDPGIETYLVFRLIEPMWGQANDEVISRVAERIRSTQERIQSILAHPIRKTLDNAFKRRAIIIHLLRDVISSAPERAREILESPEELETTLKEFYEKRYRDNRVRLQRTAVRAVIFIFITKMLVALLAEVPYEILKTGHFNLVALGVTTFLPPLVLLGAALAIRMPGEEKNFVRLVMDFEMLIAAEEPSTPLDVFKPDRRRSFATILGLTVLYIANFTLTFSIVAWFLKALHFNWLSSSLFIFFLSLVAFFALRLRKTANELAALEERESYGRAIIDFLTFPIVELGRLLAKGLSSINAVSFIFDFFIEAPFHAFVAILEEWITFMKERKKSM